MWVSDVRPGREHDTRAARADPQLLDMVDTWNADGRTVLADLGSEGEHHRLLVPLESNADSTDRRGEAVPLTKVQQSLNALHSATRARAEAGNAWLKMTFTALRVVCVNP